MLRALRREINEIPQPLYRIERKVDLLLALSTDELNAVNSLSADIDKALNAALNLVPQLKEQVATLTEARDALQVNESADQNQVRKLTDTIASMQATIDGHAQDVVAALSGLDTHVSTFSTPQSPDNPSTPNVVQAGPDPSAPAAPETPTPVVGAADLSDVPGHGSTDAPPPQNA